MIITDNGRQLDNASFDEFYEDLQIIHSYTSVIHLQINEEAEVTNYTIMNSLKTWLDKAKGF